MLARLEPNDLALVRAPFGKDFIRANDEPLEHMGCERDLIVPMGRRKKDMVPAQFKLRRLFRKVTICPVQLSTPPRSSTERGEDDRQREIVKPLKALTITVCRINGETKRVAA